ncbi:MAG: hypothetical protein QM765_36515 [Myxococcales bacterium]
MPTTTRGFDRSAVEAVRASPLLHSLRVADLSGNHLGDEDVTWLSSMPFGHLEKLVLRRNFFTKSGAKELKQRFPKADLANQRTRVQPRARAERYDETME